jgi:Domain of unknown function (DUF4911)
MNDLELIYLATAPEHIAYVKFIFESYEEVGVIRTVDRKRAVIVLLAMPDFAATARAILQSLKKDIPLEEIPPPAEMTDDWFLKELADELSSADGKKPK